MYYYRHVNGQVISKPDVVVDPVGPYVYFSGPFVVTWWHETDEDPDEEPERT